MPSSIFFPLVLLLLLHLPRIPVSVVALPPPRGFFINCGSSKDSTINGFQWLTDDGFVWQGNKSTVATPGVAPMLASLRYFPEPAARKSCYVFPVVKGFTYFVRTTYYYGTFDGGSSPPVFDQIIAGTHWITVNTSADYARGHASYYEIVVGATGKSLSVCVARNAATGVTASPFISALEVEPLENSVYNSTDFSTHALATVARHRFGRPGPILSYPDDPFNRYWESFDDGGKNPVVESHSKVKPSEFWNLPPEAAFVSGLTASRGKQLVLQWPTVELPTGGYYVALYFQDYRTPSPYSWRVFSVTVNGKLFYKSLNVSAAGVMVYSGNWLLGGKTEITLTPEDGSPVGPVINAGEVLQLLPLEGRTVTRDVVAMEELARSLNKAPADWRGDPCLPKGNSWTGVTCSKGKLVRVVSLNLTNHGLSGPLPKSLANLTALTSIWLGGNSFSGTIPNMEPLKQLVSLHLEDNQLTGPVPEALGKLEKIKEIFLQNNNLEGQLPENLRDRNGISIQTSPGNNITP